MGYAIAGLYVILVGLFAPVLYHLINLTDRVSKIEAKIDNLITEVKRITDTITLLHKKLSFPQSVSGNP